LRQQNQLSSFRRRGRPEGEEHKNVNDDNVIHLGLGGGFVFSYKQRKKRT